MFGGSAKSSGGFMGGGSSESNSILPNMFQDEPACAGMCPNLSYKHRVMGYVACSAIGFVLSLIGTLILFGGTSSSNIEIFAILYVMGNVIALCATGFLLGPKQQCIKMWLPTRRYSTAFYLLMMIIVFIVAVLKQNVFLVLFLLAVEIIAGCWYSMSYIPFARKIAMAALRSVGICYPCFYVHDSVTEAYAKHQKSSAKSSSSSSSTAAAASNVFGGGARSESSGTGFSNMFGGGKK